MTATWNATRGLLLLGSLVVDRSIALLSVAFHCVPFHLLLSVLFYIHSSTVYLRGKDGKDGELHGERVDVDGEDRN